MARPQYFLLYTNEEAEGFLPKESWVAKAQDRSDALVKLLPKLFLSGRTIRASKHRELFVNDLGTTTERKVFVTPLEVNVARPKRFAVLALGAHGVDIARITNVTETTIHELEARLSVLYGSTQLDKFVIKVYRIL